MKLWMAVIAIDLTICTGILVYEAYKALVDKPVAVFNLTPEIAPDRGIIWPLPIERERIHGSSNAN